MCPFGRRRDDAHAVCRSCLRQGVASCETKRKVRLSSKWEEHFLAQVRLLGLPEPQREVRFCERKWRFDFAWPEPKVALEVQGGVHSQGRHTRGKGYENDIEKRQEAERLGWRILWAAPKHVKSGAALQWVEEALKGRP